MFADYDAKSFFDEVFEADGTPRPHYADIIKRIRSLSPVEFGRRRALADLTFRNQGITFTVYGDESGTERTFPFDLLPRIIPAVEWSLIEGGLIQRVRALNLFLRDIYHEAKILDEGVIPRRLVLGNPAFRREVHGIALPHDVYTHVSGIDLIRGDDGRYMVLEDNLRTPSGVSYMLANRMVMTRTFPLLFEGRGVRPVQHYTTALLEMLRSLSPRDLKEPTIVLLTPGLYNSAYFEHAWLARAMGVELVEGRDLICSGGVVRMRDTSGERRVDVIYRRVDDEFLDPVQFRADSTLGIRVVDVEQSIGRKVDHTIVSDGRSVVYALNRGIPFFVSNREAQVSQDILRLANAVSGVHHPATTATAATAESAPKLAKGKSSIFAWRS